MAVIKLVFAPTGECRRLGAINAGVAPPFLQLDQHARESFDIAPDLALKFKWIGAEPPNSRLASRPNSRPT